MSFDVFLVPSSATPDGGGEARAATERALTACGAHWGGSDDADIVLTTGEEIEFYGANDQNPGAMFALRGALSSQLAQVIFAVADATRCFITAPLEQPRLLRTPGNKGQLSAEDAEEVGTELIVEIADAAGLVAELSGGLGAWVDYAAAVTGGVVDESDDEDDDDPVIDPTLLDRFFKRPKNGS